MKNTILPDSYNIIDEAILVINSDYEIEELNSKGEELFGALDINKNNRKYYNVFYQQDNPHKSCPIYCLKNNLKSNSEHLIEHNNRHYKVRAIEVLQKNGYIKYFAFFTDVTNLVQEKKNHKNVTEEYNALQRQYKASAAELDEKNKKIILDREQYEILFANMNTAFAYSEIILDEEGTPCDYRFLDCNNMFENYTNLTKSEIIGKTVSEILPETEKYWIETFGKVAISGEPIHFTNYSKALGKHYESRAYSTEKGFFVVTFNDISQRVKAKEDLKIKNEELVNSLDETLQLNMKLEKSIDELHTKESVLQTIFNNAPSIMMLLDENTDIISMNSAGLELTGKSEKDIVGLRGGDVLHCIGTVNNSKGCGHGKLCADCPLRQTFEHTLKTGKNKHQVEVDFTIIGENNEKQSLNFLVSTTIIPDKTKQVLVTLEDVTKIKQQQEAILERETRYKSLYHNSPLAYQSLDANGRFLDVNPTWIKVLGYNKDEIIGKLFSDLMHSTMVSTFKARFPKFKKEGTLTDAHFKLKRKDGEYIDVAYEGNVGYTEKGDFKQTYCTFTDITEKMASEVKLKELLHKLETIFLVNPSVIGQIKDRTILEINDRIFDLLGYKPEELIGQSALNLYPSSEEFNFVGTEKYRQIELTGKGVVETKFKRKDGSTVDVLLSSAPVDPSDMSKGTIFTALDISEIIESQRSLEKKNKEHEILNEQLKGTNKELNQVKESLKIKLDTILSPKEVSENIQLIDFIDLELLQKIQDSFSAATNVSSIITDIKGNPITATSNFSELCTLIGQTSKGAVHCMNSDKRLGKLVEEGKTTVIRPCLGCGLYDAITPMILGGKVIAYWLIGQIRTPDITDTKIANYAKTIGANEKELVSAFNKLEITDLERFKSITRHSEIISEEISQLVYNNMNLAKSNEQIKSHEKDLQIERDNAIKAKNTISDQNNELELHNERLKSLLRIAKINTSSKHELLDYALHEAITITQSKIGYIYLYDETTKEFTLNSWSKDVMKECLVTNPQTKYELNHTGFWGEVVRQKKSIIVNDFKAPNKYKKVVPSGHVALNKFMSIPVLVAGKIMAVAGVANKERDYTKADEGQLTILMDTVWNIYERIGLIEDLKIEKERAEKADKLKTVFLTNISHEIRTPLNGLIGFSEIMATKTGMSAEEKNDYSTIIQQSSNELLKIVDDIIDISTIDSQSLTIEKSTFEINTVLSDLFNKYTQKFTTVKLKYKRGVGNIRIHSDEKRIVQIITNLLDNAYKFTHEGEVEFGVHQISNDYITFFVRDTGIGISDEEQEVIFDRFRQVELSANRLYGGNGLGLAIVKELLSLLGGSIWLKSKTLKGSTFYFNLPYEEEYNTHLETESIIIQNTPFPKIEHELNILVVEDDKINSVYLEDILSDSNVKVTFATTGKDGINKARETLYDLILMDIRLPDINGFRVTKKILEFDPDVSIIAQTAYAMPNDEEEAYECGCTDYISKPFEPKALLEKIVKIKVRKPK